LSPPWDYIALNCQWKRPTPARAAGAASQSRFGHRLSCLESFKKVGKTGGATAAKNMTKAERTGPREESGRGFRKVRSEKRWMGR